MFHIALNFSRGVIGDSPNGNNQRFEILTTLIYMIPNVRARLKNKMLRENKTPPTHYHTPGGWEVITPSGNGATQTYTSFHSLSTTFIMKQFTKCVHSLGRISTYLLKFGIHRLSATLSITSF